MRYILVFVFTTGIVLFSVVSNAQNLELIGKGNPLKITGGVSTNQIFYTASGIDSRRDPYNYFFSGNLNFNLYGWSVPLSFTYSNQNSSFQQPFNQYGLHPQYKWIAGHIGYVSMSFSPYTLSGHLFQGVGIDLTPKDKFKFSAMYGRLQKAVESDTLSDESINPYFKRMGYGIKFTYGEGSDLVSLVFFRAKDEISSIRYVPDNEKVLPEENLVMSVSGSKSLFGKLVLSTELASSGITRDIRAQKTTLVKENLFNYTGNLFTTRTSSIYYNAIKSGLTYSDKIYSVGLSYERIDPEYRTHGAYYFNNDLENITVNATTNLFVGKVNLAINVGRQRDNLDKNKISTLSRWVSAINVGYAMNPQLTLSGSYSNFQSYTNIRSQFIDINQLTPYDNLDTLNFTQISQNANLNISYILSTNEEKRQNISANISFQDAVDEQGGVEQNSGSQFYNSNVSYNLSLAPRNISFTLGLNFNENVTGDINSSTFGPTLSVSKSLFEKKLKTTFGSSLNNSYNNGIRQSRIMNIRLNGAYTIKKKHNLNISLVTVNRNTSNVEATSVDFTEYTATFGYNFNF